MIERFHRWLTGRESLRSRITFVATFSFGIAFAMASVAMVRTVRSSLESSARQTAQDALRDIVDQLQRNGRADKVAPTTADPVAFQIFTSDGDVLAGSTAPDSKLFRVTKRGVVTPEGDMLVEQQAVVVDATGQRYTVAAARPLADIRRSVDELARVLKLVIPLLVIFLGGLVWFLVGRALRPVEHLRAQLAGISGATLDRRVSVPDADAEVAQLAETMNAMLDRIEESSARQREFVSDASHELRSPTSTIRTELEVALHAPGATDWPDVAGRVLGETERLNDLVDDLLALARFDEGAARIEQDPVDLDDLVLDELDRTHRVPLRTDAVSAGRVVGDARRLAQVVRNLVDNAQRHAHSVVAAGVMPAGDRVLLTIDDDGPGIAAEDRERVFERFSRLDPGRSRLQGGTGLGLALVRRIVDAHGGSIVVGDSPLGGARFTVSLPAVADGPGTPADGPGTPPEAEPPTPPEAEPPQPSVSGAR